MTHQLFKLSWMPTSGESIFSGNKTRSQQSLTNSRQSVRPWQIPLQMLQGLTSSVRGLTPLSVTFIPSLQRWNQTRQRPERPVSLLVSDSEERRVGKECRSRGRREN